MFLLVGLVTLSIFLLYYYLNTTFSYWKKRKIPHLPVSYVFGNLGKTFTFEKSAGQLFAEIYNRYPNLPYVGYYKIRQPGIVLRDPDLIKTVLIKKFDCFHDNDLVVDIKIDPIGGRNTFVLKGEQWKHVKNQVTPFFTTKKLKEMYPLFEDAINKLLNYLENETETTTPDGLETMELATKYSTEVVAGCVFGLEGKSFDEPNPQFRSMGDKIFDQSTLSIVKILLIQMFPSLSNILKLKFISTEVADYFRTITMQTIEYRKEHKIVRNDFLDIMAENMVKDKLDEDDLVAHALSFFIDGFSTSASVIAHTLFEIAANSDVQEKLLLEIQTTLKENKGKINYDVLNEMKYLDAVINESLRMHLPGQAILRMVTKPTHLPNINGSGEDLALEVGTPIIIPVLAMHYDPQYFPEPERFNPERFNENFKDLKNRCLFLPFGEGPRSCHGQRFGLIQTKLALINVIAKFEIKVNKKTQTPLEIDPTQLITHAKGGLWLNYEKRQ